MQAPYLTPAKLEQFTEHLGYPQVTWEIRPYHFASKKFPLFQIELAHKIANLIRQKLDLDCLVVGVVQSGNEKGRRILILNPAVFAQHLLSYEKTLQATHQLALQMQQTSIN